MNAEDYRADKESKEPSLNASICKILCAQSPLHAWIAHPRLNPNYQPDHPREFDLGNAAHHVLFEGRDKLAVIAADDWRTKAAREARDAAINEGKLPLLMKEEETVSRMVERAQFAWDDCPDFEGYYIREGSAEETIMWREEETHFRARLDWLSNDRRLIVDYKTTRASAQPEAWLRTGLDQGADVQAALYLRAVKEDQARFVFLVQEAAHPYCCSFIGASPSFLELGAWKVERAIKLWRECLSKGVQRENWPGYDPRVHYVEPPAYAMAEMIAGQDLGDA